eukprot:365495-Chlamydomonas_euryale.AAC.6
MGHTPATQHSWTILAHLGRWSGTGRAAGGAAAPKAPSSGPIGGPAGSSATWPAAAASILCASRCARCCAAATPFELHGSCGGRRATLKGRRCFSSKGSDAASAPKGQTLLQLQRGRRCFSMHVLKRLRSRADPRGPGSTGNCAPEQCMLEGWSARPPAAHLHEGSLAGHHRHHRLMTQHHPLWRACGATAARCAWSVQSSTSTAQHTQHSSHNPESLSPCQILGQQVGASLSTVSQLQAHFSSHACHRTCRSRRIHDGANPCAALCSAVSLALCCPVLFPAAPVHHTGAWSWPPPKPPLAGEQTLRRVRPPRQGPPENGSADQCVQRQCSCQSAPQRRPSPAHPASRTAARTSHMRCCTPASPVAKRHMPVRIGLSPSCDTQL